MFCFTKFLHCIKCKLMPPDTVCGISLNIVNEHIYINPVINRCSDFICLLYSFYVFILLSSRSGHNIIITFLILSFNNKKTSEINQSTKSPPPSISTQAGHKKQLPSKHQEEFQGNVTFLLSDALFIWKQKGK